MRKAGIHSVAWSNTAATDGQDLSRLDLLGPSPMISKRCCLMVIVDQENAWGWWSTNASMAWLPLLSLQATAFPGACWTHLAWHQMLCICAYRVAHAATAQGMNTSSLFLAISKQDLWPTARRTAYQFTLMQKHPDVMQHVGYACD